MRIVTASRAARSALLALLPVAAGNLAAQANGAGADARVSTVMRHVDLHVDQSIVLHVEFLRGELRPTPKSPLPVLDDKGSFVLLIDSARIALSTAGLSALLNRYVFTYPGSPLRRVKVSIVGQRLEQRGVMHGIPFLIVSEVTVTPAGELRLRPTTIKALGVSVKGLMGFFGIQLKGLLNLDERGTRGLRAEGNDLFLIPARLLPAPRAEGRLASVVFQDTLLVQTFRPSDTLPSVPTDLTDLTVPTDSATNYMYYRGGSLRFGHLTMTPADLLIVDADPRDPFDFYQDHYLDQLVAGSSRTTPVNGLITTMPDFNDLPIAKGRRGTTPRP